VSRGPDHRDLVKGASSHGPWHRDLVTGTFFTGTWSMGPLPQGTFVAGTSRTLARGTFVRGTSSHRDVCIGPLKLSEGTLPQGPRQRDLVLGTSALDARGPSSRDLFISTLSHRVLYGNFSEGPRHRDLGIAPLSEEPLPPSRGRRGLQALVAATLPDSCPKVSVKLVLGSSRRDLVTGSYSQGPCQLATGAVVDGPEKGPSFSGHRR
jgi:hypothetical protein